jgi:amidase
VAPARLDAGVRGAVERVAAQLEQLGHDIHEADPAYGILGAGVLARSSAGLLPWVAAVEDRSQLDVRTLQNARMGRLLGGRLLQRAARALERPMRRQIGSIFTRFDLVLTPTTAQPPLPIGSLDGLSNWQTDKVAIAACPYTWPWNVIGWPALSVPAGLTDDELPVGAQLLGPAYSEACLIAVAAQLERAACWHDRWPPVSVQRRPGVPGPTPDRGST